MSTSKAAAELLARYDFRENEFRIAGDLGGIRRVLEAPAWIPKPSAGGMSLARGMKPLFRIDPDDPAAIRVRAGMIYRLEQLGFAITSDERRGSLNPEFNRSPGEMPPPGPGMPADLKPLAEFVLGRRHGSIEHEGDVTPLVRLAANWPGLRALFVARDPKQASKVIALLRAAGVRRRGKDRDRVWVVPPSGEGACGTPITGDRHAIFYLDRDLAIPEFFLDPLQRDFAACLHREFGCARIFGACRAGDEVPNPLDDALRAATFGVDRFHLSRGAGSRAPARRPRGLSFPGLYWLERPKGPRPRQPVSIWSNAPFRAPPAAGPMLEDVVTPRNLLEAFRRIRDEKGGSAGPDGIRPDRIGIAESIEMVQALHALLSRSRWRPGRPREVAIRKQDGGCRTICVANVPDRIVSTCLAGGLRALADGKQGDSSHGWRPRRSHLSFLESLAGEFQARGGCFLAIDDVRHCFDGVAQHAVQEAAERLIPDDRKLRRLIVSCVRGVRPAGAAGIDQGSALSPLVMNEVLSHLLSETSDASGDPRHFLLERVEPASSQLRYADNVVAIASGREEAEQIREGWDRALAEAGMALKGGRGNGIFDPATEDVEALGFRIRAEAGSLRFGLADRAYRNLREALEGLPAGPRGTAHAEQILRGWLSAYAATISPGRDRDEARAGIIGALDAVAMSRDRRETCIDIVLEKIPDRDREPVNPGDAACGRSATARQPSVPGRATKSGDGGAGEGVVRHRAREPRAVRWALDPEELGEAIPATEAGSSKCSGPKAVLPEPLIFRDPVYREPEPAQVPTAETGEIAHRIDEAEHPQPEDKATCAVPAAPRPTAGPNPVDRRARRGPRPKAARIVCSRRRSCRWPAPTHPPRGRADPTRPHGEIHTSVPAAIVPRGSPASAREAACFFATEYRESDRAPGRAPSRHPPFRPGGWRAASGASPPGPPARSSRRDHPPPHARSRLRAVAARQSPEGGSRSPGESARGRLPPTTRRGPSRPGEGLARARPPPRSNERSQHARPIRIGRRKHRPARYQRGEESSVRSEGSAAMPEKWLPLGAATEIVRAVAGYPRQHLARSSRL